MTTKIIFASNKLGVVKEEQLQQMLDKHQLGKLIASEKTADGAMGQTMFISATEGEYVLKGNPLYPGQLVEEKYFIDHIHLHTDVPVPNPYLLENSNEIFGWSYSIMPRLQGQHLSAFSTEDKNSQFQIVEAIANTLLKLHTWKVEEFGEYDPLNHTIRPFGEAYPNWLFKRIKFWLNDAKKYSVITSRDEIWVEGILNSARSYLDQIENPTFVMGDFKPGNFLLAKKENGFEISAVFDFTNSYFGDPLADLIKLLTIYIDKKDFDVAKHLLLSYLKNKDIESANSRLKIHMLSQRILDWGCAKAMGMVQWDNDLSFSAWANEYLETIDSLLE